EAAARESAAEALWDSEERFRMLVDAIEDYSMILLDEAGRIASWNVGAERMFGHARDDVIGESLAILYPESERDAEVLLRELATVRASGRRVAEGWRVRKDGTRFYAKSVRTPVLDRTGRVVGVALLVHNFTEQRALEAQLLQAQKLESLGTLAGGVAHDFNNMLMVIGSRAELLMRIVGQKDPL